LYGTSPSTIINNQIYKDDFVEANKRRVKIGFITEITKENIEYCKQIKNIVYEFRHLEGLQGAICVNERVFRYYNIFSW